MDTITSPPKKKAVRSKSYVDSDDDRSAADDLPKIAFLEKQADYDADASQDEQANLGQMDIDAVVDGKENSSNSGSQAQSDVLMNIDKLDKITEKENEGDKGDEEDAAGEIDAEGEADAEGEDDAEASGSEYKEEVATKKNVSEDCDTGSDSD